LVAEQILRFNDAYYGVFEMCLRMTSEGVNTDYVKNAEKFLEGMREYINYISGEFPDQTHLLKELRYYLAQQENRLAEVLARYDNPNAD